jgi:hypothetical protein
MGNEEAGTESAMSDWMAIAQWQECERLARPGIVFEIQNADGLSLFAPCSPNIPAVPFDWKSPQVRFRAVFRRRLATQINTRPKGRFVTGRCVPITLAKTLAL